MRDIDADQLTGKMCSAGLLTDHQQTVISSGHTVHHRNWLLLEYVRQMDPESLLKFCKLLQEEWTEIGIQLIIGTYIYVRKCCRLSVVMIHIYVIAT